MKKVIILDKNFDENKHVFTEAVPSVIDLPKEISGLLIDMDKVKFRVKSWCMFPIIWAGDLLKIALINPRDAKKGDIILYKSGHRAYAHRLVSIYNEKGKLYMVTSGEISYKSGWFRNHGGVPADNILGKVVGIERNKAYLNPYEAKLNLLSSIEGASKMSLWILAAGLRQCLIRIFLVLQKNRLYRCILRIFMKNASFFIGVPLINSSKEINNFCFYRKFDDGFVKDYGATYGVYNLSARILGKPIGNIGLLVEEINKHKVCVLSNLLVRIPFRGAGIGRLLVEKAVDFSGKINVDEIKVVMSQEDSISIRIFNEIGFKQ